ncbi:MAG: SUF system NifU family Fe-S cluster assembly protein [Spirochaetaceae bacterium]|nr:SUF system NifU family Fe-S cluster assembly protein [Spirochaetaceae bacterium]
MSDSADSGRADSGRADSGRAELYQQVILEHNRSPRNYGPLGDATYSAEGDNPLCGDRYTIDLRLDEDGKVAAIGFYGAGCAISKASASLMTETVTGMGADEVTALFEHFHDLVRGRLDPSRHAELGKLQVFSGIWEYPARVKCAILSWHALSSALAGGGAVTTET